MKKNIRVFFLSENVKFLEVKFSMYLNRRVFVMLSHGEIWADYDVSLSGRIDKCDSFLFCYFIRIFVSRALRGRVF